MSVKLQQRPRTVRQPQDHRPPAAGDSPAAGSAEQRAERRSAAKRSSDVRIGLIGLAVVAAVLLAFTAMVLLTALAGGNTFLS
jgi:hypothetical protein